jgi:hypothetical protein
MDVKPGRYRQSSVGKGFTVCEMLLKNMNALSASEPPMACAVKIHPRYLKFFSLPVWEELDVQKNLKLVYSAEGKILALTPPGTQPLPYDQWLARFKVRVSKGTARPRLRKTVMALNQRGPETLISYESAVGGCERQSNNTSEWGSYMFVMRDNGTDPLEQIEGTLSPYAGVLRANGKAYLYDANIDAKYFGSVPRRVWGISLREISKFPTFEGRYIALERCRFEVDHQDRSPISTSPTGK